MVYFSVIIPVYKDWERLLKCISHLEQAINQLGESVEVIVIDNDREHHPPERLLQIEWVKLVHEPRPGSYQARNSGVKEAAGKYLAFTDADCLPDKDWLSIAKSYFEETDCDMIGGRIDTFKEPDGSENAFFYEQRTAFPQEINIGKGCAVTANLVMKRHVFEETGGFDTTLKSGGDWDFSLRAAGKGFSLIYADDMVVAHPARKSFYDIFKKQKRLTAGGYVKVRKNYNHSGARIFLSSLKGSFRKVGSQWRKSGSFSEKTALTGITMGLQIYKLWYQLLFALRVKNPNRIR